MNRINIADAAKSVEVSNDQAIVLIPHEKLESEFDRARNIFRVNKNSEIIWQVADYNPMPALSTFTSFRLENEVILGQNFDGGCYRINKADGSITGSELTK
jgi:hypothetical protein